MSPIAKFPTAKVKAKAAINRAVTSAKMTVKSVHNEVKTWGVGEWGSVVSFVGIGAWVFDRVRKGKK